MSLLTKLFNFVLITSAKHRIDESHGLLHSMDVLQYANRIYDSEVVKHPFLKSHEKIIYVSAAIHDMCDKKYMNETEGIREIDDFLSNLDRFPEVISNSADINLEECETLKLTNCEINAVKAIISTMSYSTVKKYGYPNLGSYQRAYHIVREADLLCAYDFDRSMVYHMQKNKKDLLSAYDNAYELFQNRVLKHNDDNLFMTDYSKEHSIKLHSAALKRIDVWRNLVRRPLK